MKYVTLCCYIGEFPWCVKTLFFSNVVLKKLITSLNLNIFQKLQKEVLDEYYGHLTTFCAIFRFRPFSCRKIWKSENMRHVFTFHRCLWYSSNTSFWNFWKILRFGDFINFLRTTRQKKKRVYASGEFPYITTQCNIFHVKNQLKTS